MQRYKATAYLSRIAIDCDINCPASPAEKPFTAVVTRHRYKRRCIDSLAEMIIGSADYCIPKLAPKPNYQREVSAHILQLVSQRNRLRNVYYRTKHSCLKPAINGLSRQISPLMRIWKTSLQEEQHSRTHGNSPRFWKLIRSTNTKRRAVLLHDGDNLLSLVEQGETLAEGDEERVPHQQLILENHRRLLVAKAPSSSHIASRSQHLEERKVRKPLGLTTSLTFF